MYSTCCGDESKLSRTVECRVQSVEMSADMSNPDKIGIIRRKDTVHLLAERDSVRDFLYPCIPAPKGLKNKHS